ncbi:MAG: uroporphyrinogen-III synthase [Parvibaculaceae bacterium]
MRLLVTRPDDDAAPLVATLESLGHEVLHAPMLMISFLDGVEIADRDWAGLLFTSANGVRALAARDDFAQFRPLLAFAVGEASAAVARDAGFARVIVADGDVVSLAQVVAENHSPQSGPLLHVAGSAVAGDLAGDLGARGIEVHRAVLYEAEMARALPDIAAKALMAGNIEGVLLFSPRTAAAFAASVEKAGLQGAMSRLTGFCLSQAVAHALKDLSFERVLVADRPEQAALLVLIGR